MRKQKDENKKESQKPGNLNQMQGIESAYRLLCVIASAFWTRVCAKLAAVFSLHFDRLRVSNLEEQTKKTFSIHSTEKFDLSVIQSVDGDAELEGLDLNQTLRWDLGPVVVLRQIGLRRSQTQTLRIQIVIHTIGDCDERVYSVRKSEGDIFLKWMNL